MRNLLIGVKDKQQLREYTGHIFEEQRIYVGDLLDYVKGRFREIGEVTRQDTGYYAGGKPLDELDIVRVINMGGAGTDGKYV
jgi:hypothetical protein